MRIRFGSFELDDEHLQLRRDGAPIALRPKAFDLLVVLVRERDRVVRREELFERLWSTTAVGFGSLSGLVNELRTALGESGRGPSSIRTVHARGYQFVAPVADVRSASRSESGAPTGARADARERSGSGDVALQAADQPDGSLRVGGASLRESLEKVRRAGARALVAWIPAAPERSAWLARATAEAMGAGFRPWRPAPLHDGRAGGTGVEVRSIPMHGRPCDASPAPLDRVEREPVALGLDVADPAAWARAGGLRRLLDLLGAAPVLVIAGLAEPGEESRDRDWAMRDARIDCADGVGDGAVVGRSVDKAPDSHPEPSAGLVGTLRALERSDRSAFEVALRMLGFESTRVDPIRAMRRVQASAQASVRGRPREMDAG